VTVGSIKIFPVHLGDAFTAPNGVVYLLCNGKSYSRSTYSSLSTVWPSGSYGSDDVNIHLPDLNNIALRGQTTYVNSFDPDVASRTALSGSLPTTSGIGSYQASELELHFHLDSQEFDQTYYTAGNAAFTQYQSNNGDVPTTATVVSGYGTSSTPPVTLSGSSSSSLGLPHTKVYFYITAT